MDILTYLLNGLGTALQPENVMFAFFGALLGTLVGVLPGIGPTSGIAMLLPLTTVLEPVPALIMLAGIYYGAMYGGSTTAILMNIPGEISSVPTALDGYQMAKQGRAGVALATAAISSFVAGTLSLVGLTFFAPSLAKVALAFGPPEYVGLMFLALSVVINLSGKSILKGLAAAIIGLTVATIGLDPMTGISRFTFGSPRLLAGIDFISVIIGLFAVTEILVNAEQAAASVFVHKVRRLMPTLDDLRRIIAPTLRSTTIGFFLGLIPGCSPGVVSFLAYDTEKRIAKDPEKFGTGVIEGVAAPEGANNACTSGGFVPLMSFGIPSGPALSVLLGGFLMYGLQPGPSLFEKNPDFVWALIASMYVGNIMLLVLNLPLVGLWANRLRIPYPRLAPAILVFCFVGAFSVRDSLFDVWVALFFALLGYIMRKLDYPATPLVLCTILASLLEVSLKQTLSISQGSLLILLSRPISLTLIVFAVILTGISLYARYGSSVSARAIVSAGEDTD
jgi:putative tricarboxylic transport membrane protein